MSVRRWRVVVALCAAAALTGVGLSSCGDEDGAGETSETGATGATGDGTGAGTGDPSVGGGLGSFCSSDFDCAAGLYCVISACSAVPGGGGGTATTGDETGGETDTGGTGETGDTGGNGSDTAGETAGETADDDDDFSFTTGDDTGGETGDGGELNPLVCTGQGRCESTCAAGFACVASQCVSQHCFCVGCPNGALCNAASGVCEVGDDDDDATSTTGGGDDDDDDATATTCTSDAQCTSAALPRCNVSAQKCVGCLEGADCAAPRPLCDSVTLSCVECLRNSDCGSNGTCTAGVCQSGGGGSGSDYSCRDDSECPSDFCVSGTCYCFESVDCYVGDVCDNNSFNGGCVACPAAGSPGTEGDPCIFDSDCAAGYECDFILEVCLQSCSVNEDCCRAGYTCDFFTGTCGP